MGRGAPASGRVATACKGDFDVPGRLDGGDDGFQRAPRRDAEEAGRGGLRVMFSPRCVPPVVDRHGNRSSDGDAPVRRVVHEAATVLR